jgi:hypothetical protein
MLLISVVHAVVPSSAHQVQGGGLRFFFVGYLSSTMVHNHTNFYFRLGNTELAHQVLQTLAGLGLQLLLGGT